jgi:hypothetical protein
MTRLTPVLATALALAAGLYGTLFFALQDPGPSPEVIARHADRLRAASRAHDPIHLLPFYATRAREFLGDRPVFAVRDPVRQDLELAERVWLFGLFDAAEPVRQRLETAEWRVSEAWSEDGVEVVGLVNPEPWQRKDDLTQRFATATVTHVLPLGAREDCPYRAPRRRFACRRNPDWFYVAPEYHHMGDHPQRCWWAHPPQEGALEIRFDGVRTDGVLVGRGGHTLYSSRHARAPVHLAIAIDGLGQVDLDFALEETWAEFRVPLQSVDTATTSVTFAVWSDDPGANHFCFIADVRGPAGG